MRSRDLSSWMWDDALSLLEQAERLHRQFFRAGSGASRCWEPPVDIVETARTLMIQVALPGVARDSIGVDFGPSGVTITGERRFPAARAARIHRIEIPYGRFERTVALPLHALEPAQQEFIDGCLLITFDKLKEAQRCAGL